jgi:hypothetical protein
VGIADIRHGGAPGEDRRERGPAGQPVVHDGTP